MIIAINLIDNNSSGYTNKNDDNSCIYDSIGINSEMNNSYSD